MTKIIHISSDDIKYGASRAGYRLHKSLLDQGITSKMIVLKKFGDDHTVIGPPNILSKGMGFIRPFIDELPLNILHRNRQNTQWSLNWFPGTVLKIFRREKPDLVHLHWIGGGTISIAQLARIPCPMVWTFHDMWAFTGGCHYTGECTGYYDKCGACPQLKSSRSSDLSRWTWNRKEKWWRQMNVTIITPSNWMARCVKESRLLHTLPIRSIPYCLDLQTYRAIEREQARTILNLPRGKKLILFGAVNAASDTRKGFHFLQPTLQTLYRECQDIGIELVIFGASESPDSPDMGFKTHYMGTLSDDVTLALLYSAADVFIAPSIQDNLPNTVLEATACGTPSVAFNIGGMSDLIEHKITGYLAQPFSTKDLGRGIIWILEKEDRYQAMSRSARGKAERDFSPNGVAKEHINLYNEIIHQKKGL